SRKATPARPAGHTWPNAASPSQAIILWSARGPTDILLAVTRREFRWRPALLGSVLLIGLPATAQANRRPADLQGRAKLQPARQAARTQVRTHRARVAAPTIASPSHAAIVAELGADTWLSIDADTGVLASIVPRGLAVAGEIDRFALEFVARHIDALAP